ncbi:hypothetical protein Z052_17335 [Halorubrum sp. C191]|uniref:DUF7093 family protein n=1 Tax=Halorubrum sp. C191 TaxID=1383842 RepID=UPI000C088F6D|nr:hypothetical protein [Halorubrum sp. C191]PHQ40957.1 hypothetical protein Z052_17335 [Halorubrum sp. C191]
MGLRCLLGHDFGEPELQREREEEGDEVVTTVKEVKTCARCGETQIVSENTEVTTMEQLADEAAANAGGETAGASAAAPTRDDAPDAAEEGAGPGTASGGVGAADAGTADEGVTLDEEPGAGSDDAVILDDGAAADEPAGPTDAAPAADRVDAATGAADGPNAPDDAGSPDGADPADEDTEVLGAGGESASAPSPPAETESGAPSGDDADAEGDDGVILDEDEEPADDRERGAWPEVDEEDAGADGATAWPDHGGEDEGFSAEVGEGGDADVEFGGGLTPEAADGREEQESATEYVKAPDDGEGATFDAGGEGGTGITRGESPELETVGDDAPTEYYCPECGMVRAADGSSMRAGDICPECKRGYVDERPR